MIGAMLRYVIGRRLPLFIGSVVVAVLVVVSVNVWPVEVWAPVWALVLTGGVVLAARFDLGEDTE